MTASFGRALSVLEALANHDEPLAVSRLAELTGINRVSLGRLMVSLAAEGFVTEDELGRYTPTLRVLSPGVQVLAQKRTREVAFPFLVDLSSDVGTDVSLGFLQFPDIVFVESIFVIGGRVSSRLTFTPRPLLESHTGRMLVSKAPPQMVAALLEPADALTGVLDHTSRESLRDEIEKAKQDGYLAFDRNREHGSPAGISVPIYDHTGTASAGLVVTRPTGLDDVFLNHALPKALDTARRISAALGSRRPFTLGNM